MTQEWQEKKWKCTKDIEETRGVKDIGGLDI